jgi:hypothetical protein
VGWGVGRVGVGCRAGGGVMGTVLTSGSAVYAAAPAGEGVKVAANVAGAMRVRDRPWVARIGASEESPPIR